MEEKYNKIKDIWNLEILEFDWMASPKTHLCGLQSWNPFETCPNRVSPMSVQDLISGQMRNLVTDKLSLSFGAVLLSSNLTLVHLS